MPDALGTPSWGATWHQEGVGRGTGLDCKSVAAVKWQHLSWAERWSPEFMFPESVNGTLSGNSLCCNEVKDLEMRSSWIWGGPSIQWPVSL